MHSSKSKIVLCVSDKSDLSTPLLKLANSELLKGKEVHLIHIFKQEVYAYEFSPYLWPDNKLFNDLKIPIEKGLHKLAGDLQLNDATIVCTLHSNPKERLVEYLNEVKADTVVVVTRGKHGFAGIFSSSTADYLIKFSPCDVYVMRAQA